MKKLGYFAVSLVLVLTFASSLWAQCVDLDVPVGKEVPYDEVVAWDQTEGVIYLSLLGGSTPVPNTCGLNPINDPAEWTGWGGPLDVDNVTIGEGAGTHNLIVIGGVMYERGLGAHAIGTFVYDLTGDDYIRFECYVGMADEKDPDECGHGGSGDFIFTVDGVEMAATDTLLGYTDGENTPSEKVAFDIPAGATELIVTMGDGGDGNSCDHSCVADPKLITAWATAVSPDGHLSTTWGDIKITH